MWATSPATREQRSIPMRAPLRLSRRTQEAAGIEDSAAGEADDVVEETQGAVEGAVLVVDAGVDVSE